MHHRQRGHTNWPRVGSPNPTKRDKDPILQPTGRGPWLKMSGWWMLVLVAVKGVDIARTWCFVLVTLYKENVADD